MNDIIFSAYTFLEVNDPRYGQNSQYIRLDVLKALNRLQDTFKHYGAGDVETVSIYPSKGKVNLKLRIPEDHNHRNVVMNLYDKEGIYETVLGMVMDGREQG